MEITSYGRADESFRSAGGEAGIRRLVSRFYELIDEMPEAREIRAMHPPDLGEAVDRLTRFLCGWMGGPALYQERYGSISIPIAHRHLSIGAAERDAWLLCMERAIAEQPYAEDFAAYLLQQLRIPAERIREVCESELQRKGSSRDE